MEISSTGLREALWDIFFPSRCLSCRETLQYAKNEIFCPICRHQALISDTHLTHNHPLKKRLCTQFPFQLVLSKYRYPNKSRTIANLIYGLKYQNLRYIGVREGQLYGTLIRSLLLEQDVTALIPTPLHWRKKMQRGYNQSLEFAHGLANTTSVPIFSHLLKRVKSTKSQTTLNKAQRVKNMENAFKVSTNRTLKSLKNPPHFLLVDDVVTSGVTLAEMARTLQDQYPDGRFSVCTLAYKDYSW